MTRALLLIAATLTLFAATEALTQEALAQDATDAELAPTGKLRYGLNESNAALSTRGPDGTFTGVSIDLGKFIAGKLHATFEPVIYKTTGDFTRSFGKGAWDMTVVGTSPDAKNIFSFTPDTLLIDYVYLVRPGLTFTSIADVDRPGIKVGASENGSGSQFLKNSLKSAQLVLASGGVEAETDLLKSGKVDAYGSNTNNLVLVAAQLPGSTFVPGAFFAVHFAAALEKGKSPAALQRLTAIVNEAKTSGLLQGAIDKAGLKGVRIPTD